MLVCNKVSYLFLENLSFNCVNRCYLLISPTELRLKFQSTLYSTNSNSNSNWTFIALNLPKQEDSKAQQNKKQPTKFCVQGHNRGRTPRRTPGGWFRLGWICFGVQVGFKLFSEGGQGWRGTNHIRESIPHSRSIKRKTNPHTYNP